MDPSKQSYLTKKVISIGVVSELTGLSERQIRYYEERKLIFPKRTDRGTRKYSFSDVEILVEIANKMEDGIQTTELRREMNKHKDREKENNIKKSMIRGQMNAHFNRKNKPL
ncbi:MerR family transcriptional regulator [Bacillus salitolerans]|uniref:MerR family transcriptional regulator n=1 Tax=Bacillus salitolerans TaxID=1437434 RepID=A0ABW4LTP8_9BACI